MRNTFLLSLAVIIFSCGACSKDGAVGPAGATGPAGAAGPAGPTGATGTANVIYSDWLDVAYDPITGDFDEDGKLDTAAFETAIAVDKLDNDILTTGEVKVYINLGTAAAPDITPLPYFDVFAGYSINPSFSANQIYMLATNSFQTYIGTDNAKHQQYRYVLIPGGTAARTGKSVDWNNYSEVKAYLKLKD